MTQATLHINTGKKDPSTGQVVDNWLIADLDNGVNIVLKDSIKKAKDVGKVFTTFTNPFVIPASKTNNQIFKRFSNNKVYDGFDPRRKYDAVIRLNGVDFKKGYIKLNNVSLVNNLPSKYSVQFFGELTSLKDTLSNTKLKELVTLAKYSFPYDDDTVQMGFESGFDVVVNDDAGLKHASLIYVNQFPSETGVSTVTLNGVDYDLQITGGVGVTNESCAAQLADLINEIDGYGTGVVADVGCAIVSDENGYETPIGFSYGSAVGFNVTLSTLQVGSDDPQGQQEVTILENPKGDFKFPLLSHTRGFEYSDNNGFHRMLTTNEKLNNYTPVSDDRLTRFDLKPAIKISKIFEAIDEMYPSINFDTDWLFGGENNEPSPLDEMYLWLHNKKGYLGYTDSSGDNTKFTHQKMIRTNGAGALEGEWVLSSSSTELRPFENPEGIQKRWSGYLRVEDMEGDGEIQLDIKVFREGNLDTPAFHFNTVGEAIDGIVEQEFWFPSPQFPVNYIDTSAVYYIVTTIEADTSIVQFRPSVKVIQHSIDITGELTFTSHFRDRCEQCTKPPLVASIENIAPNLLMPDYKIIDFLTDLFKLYNLVAYEEIQKDGSYKINIKSYDAYINSGTEYDITQWIDISKSTVERISPYSIIEYSFNEPKTFLAINQKELTGDDFGNVEFNVNNFTEGGQSTNSLLFDGGKYKVEPKLEKMMYERINSYPSKELTTIQWGWFVNDNKENVPEPAIGKPLFLFCNNINQFGYYDIEWKDGTISTKYNAPSNLSQGDNQTLHFNTEFDEWTRELNENSLFKNFHSNHINSIYSPFAKKIKVDAYLPPLIFNKLKLNDTIIVNNISYFIDTMDINITTSKTKFSLLRVTDITTRLKGSEEGTINWEDESDLWDSANKNWDVK